MTSFVAIGSASVFVDWQFYAVTALCVAVVVVTLRAKLRSSAGACGNCCTAPHSTTVKRQSTPSTE